MDKNSQFTAAIHKRLDKIASKLPEGAPLQVLLYSPKNALDSNYSNVGDDRPYHIASIGKMFTATVIGMLQDKKLLSIDDTINKYLTKDVLSGLFVFEGVNYQDQVTIRQLLGHTSGAADYFENSAKTGPSFQEIIMNNPDKKWTPTSLIDFTRQNQSAVGAPGTTFNYSDTGYLLLGLIIEKITQKTLDVVLEEFIFKPLKMDDSYLLFYGQPSNPVRDIAPMYINGMNVTGTNILTGDWAGGGIVSTVRDLVKFQQAFWQEKLVSKNYIQQMADAKSKFRAGMYYGLGMTEMRFEGFFFLLRGLPRPKGHTGVVGTHMYYDQEHDLHIIMNFGSTELMRKSVQTFIVIEQLAKKYLSN
ncbi:MAG TPA: serine hydrolase domain-containing protein [Verrucomicrobiae bacterium]|nr:serine hydrolase domain-containing protein [Verrucomicrobiae bacterium]